MIVELIILFTWKGSSLWSLFSVSPSVGNLERERERGRAGSFTGSPASGPSVSRKVGCIWAAQRIQARRPFRTPESFSIWKGNQEIGVFASSLRSKPGRKDIEQILTRTFVATVRIYWPAEQIRTTGRLRLVFSTWGVKIRFRFRSWLNTRPYDHR